MIHVQPLYRHSQNSPPDPGGCAVCSPNPKTLKCVCCSVKNSLTCSCNTLSGISTNLPCSAAFGYFISIENINRQKNRNHRRCCQKAVHSLNKEADHHDNGASDDIGDSAKTLAFFQVVSFFMLHLVFSPVTAFIRSLGMIFPRMIIPIPRSPNRI